MNRREKQLLRIAAKRAAQRPAFLGWILSNYASSQRLSNAALAAELRCSEATLLRLGICLRPRPNRFVADVAAIASKLEVDEGVLARIVRHVEALEVMSDRGAAAGGALLAAKTRPSDQQAKENDDAAR